MDSSASGISTAEDTRTAGKESLQRLPAESGPIRNSMATLSPSSDLAPAKAAFSSWKNELNSALSSRIDLAAPTGLALVASLSK